MENNFSLKIGLAFSGGGYRSAAFNLGVLTYLDRIRIDSKSLLSQVCALSTVSGGTITGSRYALGIKNGESFQEFYNSLYLFMKDIDLINLSLNRLSSNESKNNDRVKSLITAFADIYDEYLFHGEKFGKILSHAYPTHLQHISFNATDFAFALQFRYQASGSYKLQNIPSQGIIGNYYFRIPESIAAELRMGDILASSSCFPGGFEPINFPTDFIIPQILKDELIHGNNKYPVGLMDGGIVDNQGIEPILLVEERMQKNQTHESPENNKEHELDLIIVSDVASPFMEKFKVSKQGKKNLIRQTTPKAIFLVSSILFILFGYFLIKAINNTQTIFAIVSALICFTCIMIVCLGFFIRLLLRRFQTPKQFLKPLNKLFKLRLFIYENLIMNRVNSLLKMTNDVFMKHIRRLNYNKIFNDSSWQNRRIMNAIYELTTNKGKYSVSLEEQKTIIGPPPGPKIKHLADDAFSMPTTLWFTQDELSERNMLNKLIACGQFTICWNLIEYISKIKSNSINTNKNHLLLLDCESILLTDWKMFNENPLWMVNS